MLERNGERATACGGRVNVDFSEVRHALVAAASKLRRERLRIATVPMLTRPLLEKLASEKLAAIHVPAYFSPAHARRAAFELERMEKPKLWKLQGILPTDTSFSVGTPKHYTHLSARAKVRYRKEALSSIRRMRGAFGSSLAPMDWLRLELDELWPAGAHLRHLEGSTDQAGLVRTIDTTTLLEGVAGREGVCHIDDERKRGAPHTLSVNLYLRMPARGGELKIWDVSPDPRNHANPLYRVMKSLAFHPGSQEIIHEAIEPAAVIRPNPGDLIVLDTARPHAVGGFERGKRMTIQAWIIAAGRERPLVIYS